MPSTWDEFNAAAEKLQAAGIIPLAHGGQAWQDATVFEAVALGILGSNGFHKAFVELDEETLTSDAMVAVFDQMRKMRGYVDPNFSGRDWNLATAMVMNGEAAFPNHGRLGKRRIHGCRKSSRLKTSFAFLHRVKASYTM